VAGEIDMNMERDVMAAIEDWLLCSENTPAVRQIKELVLDFNMY
jgi:hypothetical protein